MIECVFCWGKQHGTLRRPKHHGIARIGADFVPNFIANSLIRISKLIAAQRQTCASPHRPPRPLGNLDTAGRAIRASWEQSTRFSAN
jgi:hypothetical protein